MSLPCVWFDRGFVDIPLVFPFDLDEDYRNAWGDLDIIFVQHNLHACYDKIKPKKFHKTEHGDAEVPKVYKQKKNTYILICCCIIVLWYTYVNVWILFWYKRCSGSNGVNLELSERRQRFLSQFSIFTALKYYSTNIWEVSCSRACGVVVKGSWILLFYNLGRWNFNMTARSNTHSFTSCFCGRYFFLIKEFWREFLSSRCNVT